MCQQYSALVFITAEDIWNKNIEVRKNMYTKSESKLNTSGGVPNIMMTVPVNTMS